VSNKKKKNSKRRHNFRSPTYSAALRAGWSGF